MLFDFLFGCTHKHISFPLTLKPGTRKSPAAMLTGTYIVCTDCGKEFAYDWNEMKIVKRAKKSKLISIFMEY